MDCLAGAVTTLQASWSGGSNATPPPRRSRRGKCGITLRETQAGSHSLTDNVTALKAKAAHASTKSRRRAAAGPRLRVATTAPQQPSSSRARASTPQKRLGAAAPQEPGVSLAGAVTPRPRQPGRRPLEQSFKREARVKRAVRRRSTSRQEPRPERKGADRPQAASVGIVLQPTNAVVGRTTCPISTNDAHRRSCFRRMAGTSAGSGLTRRTGNPRAQAERGADANIRRERPPRDSRGPKASRADNRSGRSPNGHGPRPHISFGG